MNLRDDKKKTSKDLWLESRNERFTKYCKYKDTSNEIEEANQFLCNTFNKFLTEELKDTGASIIIVVHDNQTTVHIRTTLACPCSTIVNISFNWPDNMLITTSDTIVTFIGDIKSCISKYNDQFPGMLQKLDNVSCETRIETKTKFFKQ